MQQAAGNGTMLSLRDVRIVRGERTVLSVEKLDLAAGIHVLEGPNGAGKSTVLLAAAGLVDLAAGQVLLDGTVLHDGMAPAPVERRRRIALVFQDPYLMSGTVREAVEIGLKIRRVGSQERRTRVDPLLERLGLKHLASKRSTKLSGGERRKVALAQALVLDSQVLLLDEVTVNLDEASKQTLIDILRERAGGGHQVIVIASHDSELAHRLDARVHRLAGGRVLDDGVRRP